MMPPPSEADAPPASVAVTVNTVGPEYRPSKSQFSV
jgi:hypothetical protein